LLYLSGCSLTRNGSFDISAGDPATFAGTGHRFEIDSLIPRQFANHR
jgi:hypothetical protein